MGEFTKEEGSNLTGGYLYRFGQFALDARKRMLYRGDSPVVLTPKAFDVLLFLVQNPNRLVTKEELLQAVWGNVFVEEGNLTQYISHLRKALDDTTEDSRLIVTIARRGYQLTPRVTVVPEEEINAASRAIHQHAGETSKTEVQSVEVSREAGVTESAPSRVGWGKWFAAITILAVVAVSLGLDWKYRHRVTLSASDTIVLAEATNNTSDPVFDDSLDSALRCETEQTPYLNILGRDKVLGALAQLKLPPATKLTPDVARQVCLNTNSKLVISQSIGDAGNGYHLQMQAVDCASGATLAQEQPAIVQRHNVIHEVGVTAERLRATLGEPADSLARFNQPLEKALSGSPESVQAASQGLKLSYLGDAAGGLKLYQRAVELDPEFALAHARVGAANLILGNIQLSEEAYTRAYQLRDRMTERDRLAAETYYYSYAIGDWEKQYSSALRYSQIFPRDASAHVYLREAYVHLGQPGRAADEAAEVARLRPSAYYFGSTIQSVRFASRFNEAKSWLAKADALKFDDLLIRRERLIVAFVTGDHDTVEKILKEEEQGKHREDFLVEHALIEIQQGRFHSAESLRKQALAQTSKADGADLWIFAALEDAEVGKDAQAKLYAGKAAGTPLDRTGKIALAQALARSVRTEEAGKLADEVSAERPEDTLVQHYFVPTIRAAIKLGEHDPAAAIDLLRDTEKYDLAFTGFDYVYPAYIRGLADLQLGDGRSAAAQFQKMIDNPGFTVRHVTGALALLQLGRAQKMAGDVTAARESYEKFLALWKNADPDIPIYERAKAEYSKLPK